MGLRGDGADGWCHYASVWEWWLAGDLVGGGKVVEDGFVTGKGIRTVRQDIQPLLAGHEVFGGLLDGGEVRQVDVQELQAAVGVGVRFLDLLNGGICFALGAAGNVDGAIVLVEDLA